MRILVLMLMAGLALTACKQTPSVPSAVSGFAYKIDIQQGNAITQEMVAKLHAGMTPAQVRYILGSPLVADPFHPERWDYVYTYAKNGKLTERRRLTVIFTENKLVRLEGDVVPDDSSLQAGQTGQDGVTDGVPVVLTPAPAGVPIDSAPPVGDAATSTSTAVPVPPPAEAAKSAAPKEDPKKEEPNKDGEKGFFGKMMDKIGL